MVDFKKLFNKDFLKGDKPESEITLKGVEKLAEHFKSKYNFIDISIIDENEITNEFEQFFVLFNEFIIANKLQQEIKETKIKDSNEEDTLFLKVKQLNEMYKNKKDKNLLFEEIKPNWKFFTKLLKFNEINQTIIIDLVCKKILKVAKKAKLNFFIWTDSKHYSLVANIESYFLFLDSCSNFFRRWPSKIIISKNMSDKLFKDFQTIVMYSFLQNDVYSCPNFVFSFIDKISALYIKNNYSYKNLMNYLLTFFNTFSKDGYITESVIYGYSQNSINKFDNFISLYFLPEEFLCLSQFIPEIKPFIDLLEEKGPKDKVEIIKNVIKQYNVRPEIEKMRESHLKILLEFN